MVRQCCVLVMTIAVVSGALDADNGQKRGFASQVDLGTNPIEGLAISQVRQLIREHPDLDARRDLVKWLGEGKLVLSGSYPVLSIGSLISDEPGAEGTYCIGLNPAYVLRTSRVNPVDLQRRKQLAIYRAYLEIKWDMDGRWPALSFRDPYSVLYRESTWARMYELNKVMWGLAKRMDSPHLMPDISGRVRREGEPLAILHGFCNSLIMSATGTSTEEHAAYWMSRCKEEESVLMRRTGAN